MVTDAREAGRGRTRPGVATGGGATAERTGLDAAVLDEVAAGAVDLLVVDGERSAVPEVSEHPTKRTISNVAIPAAAPALLAMSQDMPLRAWRDQTALVVAPRPPGSSRARDPSAILSVFDVGALPSLKKLKIAA